MDWQPITLQEVSQRAIFDYENGVAPNVHPNVIWGDTGGGSGGKGPRILIHDGNLSLPGLAFDTNRFVSPEADMLIVDGDLTIEGDLDVEQFDVGTPGYLVVKGDLTATNLFLSQQFELLVSGDIDVSGVVFGQEGSTGGIWCKGTFGAPVAVMADFPLSAGAAEGDIFAGLRHGESEPQAVRLSTPGTSRIQGVHEDDVTGQFWLLELPDGLAPDDVESDEELAGYSLLTDAALADYEGNGGELPIKQVLRKHGRDGFRYASR